MLYFFRTRLGCRAGAAGEEHRYYDPTTGQFLTADPLVSITGQAFAFAGDDPVNLRDPSGMAGGGPAAMCSGGEPVPAGETQAQACQAAEKSTWGYVPKPGGADPVLSLCATVDYFASGCLTVVGTNQGESLYVSPRVGVSYPKFGADVSVAVPSTASESCSIAQGASWQYGGQWGLGGGIYDTSNGRVVPYASIGFPGIGGYWGYGIGPLFGPACCK